MPNGNSHSKYCGTLKYNASWSGGSVWGKCVEVNITSNEKGWGKILDFSMT